MQALLCCRSFSLALPAPALHAGQQATSSQPEQQQPLLLLYSHGRHLPLAQVESHGRPHLLLAQVERAFAAEVSPPDPVVSKPKPNYTPQPTEFALVSLGLIALFWVGNFVVPDLIFKKMFKQDAENKSTRSVLEGLVGGTDDKAPSQGRGEASSPMASGSEASPGSETEGTVAKGSGFGNKRASKGKRDNR